MRRAIVLTLGVLMAGAAVLAVRSGTAARVQLPAATPPVEAPPQTRWNELKYLVPQRVCDCGVEPCVSSVLAAPSVAVIQILAMRSYGIGIPNVDLRPPDQRERDLKRSLMARTVIRIAGHIPDELPIALNAPHAGWVRPMDLAVVSLGDDGTLLDFMRCLEDEPAVLAASVASWRGR